jgi:radical SAM superfamily enzyme YgiQ (UPF0313 family)
MKLLLVAVNAKYIHSNLAVYSLRTFAKKYADNIHIVEYTINHSEEDILKGIYKEQADVIAFSCYIWNIDIITRIVKELKKVQPNSKIWLGGPEVSYDAEACLEKLKELDGIVIGEGEQTFLELAGYYIEGKGSLDEIDGLAFKDSGKIDQVCTVTSSRQPLSLDEIPFPYDTIASFQNKIIYYESSRGCPFSCSYCLSSIDRKVRLRNIELVKKELGFFLDHQVAQVKFVDRTFNCNKKHAMEIWKFIKENDNGITNFHFEISADLLEEEEIEFLATLRPGQVQFEIGVQSTNPDTVKAITRTMDFDKLKLIVERIHQGHNIHQHLDLIAGLPYEGYTSFEKSFADVYKLRPDQLQLGFLKVLKGSFMEKQSKAYGIIYHDTSPYEVLFTNQLSYMELLRLKGVCEMVEVYYNSGQFFHTIRFLEHFYTSPMQLYQSISDYYEEKGLNLLSHNRLRRYEILLDFCKEKVLELRSREMGQDFLAVLKELLFFDLCLREAMRSRPSFAPDLLEYKSVREITDKFGVDRKQAHVEQFIYDVLASSETGQAIRKNTTILFDYSSRDPLTKAVRYQVVD